MKHTKKSKCSKTMSGRHMWLDFCVRRDTTYQWGELGPVIFIDGERRYWIEKCYACGVINDLKEDDRQKLYTA